MKRIVALASLGASIAAPAAPAAIDLDAPGAMEALAAANPVHHARIVRVIAVAERADCFAASCVVPRCASR